MVNGWLLFCVFFIIHFCVRLQFGKFCWHSVRVRALIRACTDRITRRFYCLSISIKDAKQSEAVKLFSARVLFRRCCPLKLGKTTNWHANAGLYLFNRFNKSDLFQLSWAHAAGWREETDGGGSKEDGRWRRWNISQHIHWSSPPGIDCVFIRSEMFYSLRSIYSYEEYHGRYTYSHTLESAPCESIPSVYTSPARSIEEHLV